MAFSVLSGAQVMSDLLTIREKGVLFSVLEPWCKRVFGLQRVVYCRYSLIKTTVAQLLEAKEIEGGRLGWSCLSCGVMCLIEDESVHSYFLRLYCVKPAKLLWEQELYIPFQYTATRPFFHTFHADGHQVGLNFANEAEAEEFHFEVKAVQINQEKMIDIMTTSEQPNAGMKPGDNLSEEQVLLNVALTPVTSANSSFKDLDPAMRRLLMRARLTEQDLKDKNIAEAVDCIINTFGGIKAVQTELSNRASASQTLPRTVGASFSVALKKGALPPVPSIKRSITSQQTPEGTDTMDQSASPISPVLADTDKIRKSASFKQLGSSASAERDDFILSALKEVFRQKDLLQHNGGADGNAT